MVRTQLYIFTRNSTLGIQLHISALYIGHRQVWYHTHILYRCDKFIVQPDDGQYTGPKHVVYPMYYSVCK